MYPLSWQVFLEIPWGSPHELITKSNQLPGYTLGPQCSLRYPPSPADMGYCCLPLDLQRGRGTKGLEVPEPHGGCGKNGRRFAFTLLGYTMLEGPYSGETQKRSHIILRKPLPLSPACKALPAGSFQNKPLFQRRNASPGHPPVL